MKMKAAKANKLKTKTNKIKNSFKKIYNNVYNFCHLVDEGWKNIINSKYLKTIFKFLPHNIFTFALMLIVFFLIFKNVSTNEGSVLYAQSSTNDVFEPMIVNPVDIDFKEIEVSRDVNSVCITFATYAKKTNSDYKFVLYKNNKKEIVREEEFNSNILDDGKAHCFSLGFIKKDEIKQYSVSIEPIYTDLENVITIFKDKDTNTAAFTLNYKSDQILNFKQLVSIVFVISFFVVNYLINTRKLKVNQYWLLISFIYTLPIVFIYPPYEVPDEPVHYYNAYKFSQINFHKSLKENIENPSVYAPKNMECLNYSGIESRDRILSVNDVLECAKEDGNDLDFNYGRYNYVAGKLGYIIPGAAIKVVDEVTDSPVPIFYSGRFINYIVSTLVILLAIIIAPKYKEVILLVGTIPMFVQQAGSYSYDSIINSFSLLMISIILKMINNPKAKKIIPTLILLLLGTVIGNIKMIYLVVLLFLLLLPDEMFKKRINKYLYCFGMIIICCLLGKMTQGIFFGGTIPATVESSENLKIILANPTKIFKIAYNTFAINGVFYLRSLFGYFSWFKFKLNDLFIFTYIFMILYLIFNNQGLEAKKINKLICWIGLLICFAATFAAMYFSWSATGLDYVDGVQGRYFLAILLPFIIMCMPQKGKNKVNNNFVYSYINITLVYYVTLLLTMFY